MQSNNIPQPIAPTIGKHADAPKAKALRERALAIKEAAYGADHLTMRKWRGRVTPWGERNLFIHDILHSNSKN